MVGMGSGRAETGTNDPPEEGPEEGPGVKYFEGLGEEKTMSRVSNRKVVAETNPSLNVPWLSNRLSAGKSYRQDTFNPTIKPGPLPDDLAPRKYETPGPHFSNKPKVTTADKWAQAYLRAKDEKARIDAFQEKRKLMVPNNEGVQPWQMPQSTAQVNIVRPPPFRAPTINVTPMTPGPPKPPFPGPRRPRTPPNYGNVTQGPGGPSSGPSSLSRDHLG